MPNGGIRSEKTKKRKKARIERAAERQKLLIEKRKKNPIVTPRWF
jgi:hypothetical protein